MDLVNTTPLTAAVQVSAPAGSAGPARRGVLAAKATFEVDGRGRARAAPDPEPVRAVDEETELGVLPRDLVERGAPGLEVMMLGEARAPRYRPVEAMTVSLAVGARCWRLRVVGSRRWVGEGDRAAPSRPRPFVRMPLVWARAFGGTCPVHLDPSTVIDVYDGRNPAGRGFDPGPVARGLGAYLGAPSGYPRWSAARHLPNVEHPGRPVRTPRDAPEPAGWAPLDARMLGRPRDSGDQGGGPWGALAYRAPPGLVLPGVPPGTWVRTGGLHPDGAWGFRLPELEVEADYVLGGRRGTRALRPEVLLLRPGASRFTVLYRLAFRLQAEAGAERGFRLRASLRAPDR